MNRLQRTSVPRVVRFAIVGASGVLVNTGILWLLVEMAGLRLLVAGQIAIESAILSNFVLNDAWTFHQTQRGAPWWARCIRFHGTAIVAATINLVLLLVLAHAAGFHFILANLIAIALAAVVNYGGNALWTWRPAAPVQRAPRPFDPSSQSVVVVVPTYDEAQNISKLMDAVLGLGPQYQLLVVDDSSPDGTGAIVAQRAAAEPRVHLLLRPSKLGLGTAYRDGFREALRLGAGLVVQMDSDFSHNPTDVLRLVDATATADVAVGSRYVAGGGSVNWPWHRKLISRGTGMAYQLFLGLPVRDLSGGFKCWRATVLEELPLEDVRCRGFAFQIEMNYLTWRLGFEVLELPVLFRDREHGKSKMSVGISIEGVALLWRLVFGTPPVPQTEAG